ncbi:tetratricopeptide repeat protein [Limnospira sp. PMC 1243.20]|uniref:tetratricopeptide repeat protein n=1 Tax=Limnospira sp. PMC 1243.20 TaxID=2981041 RepID=UPI0028E15716|nr:tetratricopeptide repeat protein [Limnospira sp. PMC 1243.20]MDT9204514.1 tetratricopeptide repeat protein [Limnospira sp. PMC 1243.20]
MTDFYGFGTISHGFGMALVWGVSQLVSDLVRGNQLLRSGKLEEAVDAFQKAIAHHPHFHWSHYELGESLAALGRWQEAVDAYKKAVKYNPDFYWAYQKLGETLNKLDCWEEAVRCFRKAIDFNPKAVEPNPGLYWAYQYLGETLHRLARWEEAVTALRQAIAVNPTAKWSYFYLAEVLAKQEEWSEAIASYQKAIALNLTEPEVFWGLGKALEALNRWDEAIATYQKTIELNINKYQSYQYLGNLLLRQRQWTEAVAAHEKAVQLNPKSPASKQNLGRALFYLGKSLAEQNLWSEAVEHYRQTLDLGFDQGQVHYHLGKGLNQLGCYEEAVVELKQALEFNPLFLEWEQELEYALNQLGRTLSTESTDTWKIQVTESSNDNNHKLKELLRGSWIHHPKNNQIYYRFPVISGWILPKKHDLSSIKVIAKSDKYEHEELLSVARRDVITKILGEAIEGHPLLCCGFSFQVEPAEQIELYINIEDESYHWKTIQSTLLPYHTIVRIKGTWRKFITNNINSISNQDADMLQLLIGDGKIIYGKPVVITYQRDEDINHIDLSHGDINFKKLLSCFKNAEFCSDLIQSVIEKGYLSLPDPFASDSCAICKESFHIGRCTFLRFVSQTSGKTFFIKQDVTSQDAIYLPTENLVILYVHSRQPDIMRHFVIDFGLKFRKFINYIIQNYKNNFGGLIGGYCTNRPSHFYQEVCHGFFFLYKNQQIQKFPLFLFEEDRYFFSISDLFDVETSVKTIDDLNKNTFHNQVFLFKIGTPHAFRNVIDSEKLAKMIVKKASKLIDAETEQEVKVARECYPLLWLGVTGQKRAWVEQVEGGAKIITELAKIYPNIGVVFDGWTAPLHPTQSDINQAATDQAVVDEIVQLLPPSVKTFTVVGSTSVRKLAFATVIDVFIANKSTGSIHVDRFAKKPGVVHISNSFRLFTSQKIPHNNIVNVPSNQVIDIPHPVLGIDHTSYSINPDVILNLVKEILAQSNP